MTMTTTGIMSPMPPHLRPQVHACYINTPIAYSLETCIHSNCNGLLDYVLIVFISFFLSISNHTTGTTTRSTVSSISAASLLPSTITHPDSLHAVNHSTSHHTTTSHNNNHHNLRETFPASSTIISTPHANQPPLPSPTSSSNIVPLSTSAIAYEELLWLRTDQALFESPGSSVPH